MGESTGTLRRVARIGVRATLSVALALGVLSCSDTSDRAIRIGVLMPYSPETSDVVLAMQMAIDDINGAGGANGRPLELVIYDVMWDEDVSYSAFHQAVDDGAVAMIGGYLSRLAVREAEAALELHVPVVGCCSTSDELTNANPPGADRYFFRVAPPDRIQSVVLAARAYDRPDLACRSLAILHTDDSYGSPLAASLATEFEARGGAVVANVSHPFFQQDWTTYVATVAAGTPDCIALISNVDDARGFRSTWIGEGRPAVHWLGTDSVIGEATTPMYADNALSDGIIASAPWSFDRPEAAAFVARFEAEVGHTPTPPASGSFNAAALIGLAIVAADRLDGASVRDAIVGVANAGGTPIEADDLAAGVFAANAGEDLDFVGIGGRLEFDACGDVLGAYALFRLDASAPGGFTLLETGIEPMNVPSPCPQ